MDGRLPLAVLILHCQLIVNEFAPRPRAGEGEWLELYNESSLPVQTAGWTLHDGSAKVRNLPEFIVPPHDYLVVAQRPDSLLARFQNVPSARIVKLSSWPVLNDRDAAAGRPADSIVLSLDETPVDSVSYFESWLPLPGRSLERVSSASQGHDRSNWGWSLSIEGGTPGRRNSLVPHHETSVVLWGPRHLALSSPSEAFDYQLPGPGTLAVWLVPKDGGPVRLLKAPAAGPARGRFAWPAGWDPGFRGPCFVCIDWRSTTRRLKQCRLVWLSH